jgi:hypothetical protein
MSDHRRTKPHLKRQIKERVRKNRRSLSDGAQLLIARGLSASEPEKGLGSRLFSLIEEKDRGDDLVFEFPAPVRQAPDFE